MKKFDFLLGNWTLKYTVPKSSFSVKATGEGEGTFSRALNQNYVFFDYTAEMTLGSTAAHGIFAKEANSDIYKYWWFEDSGNYATATCKFVNDKILYMFWHDSLLIQTFEQVKKDYVVLKMSNPVDERHSELVLKVELYKK